jgi:hypothetical protein
MKRKIDTDEDPDSSIPKPHKSPKEVVKALFNKAIGKAPSTGGGKEEKEIEEMKQQHM